MSKPCPSALIESDLEVWKDKLSFYYLQNNDNDCKPELIKILEEISKLEYQLKMAKDYENNPLTKSPPFEEPKQYDIGFIPTVNELALAFQQMPSDWPGDTYRHELKVAKGENVYISLNEEPIGTLTFTKLDGQWVYFGPTKYK